MTALTSAAAASPASVTADGLALTGRVAAGVTATLLVL
jgi:hypothetical protein